MARIDSFLKLGLAQGCSDIHLAVGVPPMLRLHGDLMPIKFRDLADTELESYVAEILSESQKHKFSQGMDLDFSYISEDGGRFRVNVFRKETGVGATFRNIPSSIPSIDSLGLPPIVQDFCDLHQGGATIYLLHRNHHVERASNTALNTLLGCVFVRGHHIKKSPHSITRIIGVNGRY